MANWSQSHFLQSLGWATLNSFWQMALLWCIFLGANYLVRLSSHKKYQFAVLSIVTGFAWFLFTFFYYFKSSAVSSIAFFNQNIQENNSLLNICLLSASVTYLGLLIFPSYKLYKNWQFIKKVRKQSMQKADLNFRLFVQKIGAQLGIKKKVLVYLSDLVKSPMTIGYLKPIILLPVAALNNLSTQQVEAILLHELSHIRRYDYLVNFIISIINTILYFNPFVKQFMQTIEEERENCCDQLVLQFGYDKVSYASALLSLEKMSARQRVLALGATGKKYLLSRIEKIVGMEQKKGFSRNQLAGMLAALFCIVIFNSFLIIREKKETGHSFAYETFANPFSFSNEGNLNSHSTTPRTDNKGSWASTTTTPAKQEHAPATVCIINTVPPALPQQQAGEEQPMFVQVGLDEVDASLTKEQKDKVESTVDATKQVLANMQWKVVESNIADAMTSYEKTKVKQEYITELNKNINWENVEQNMKAQYENLDWNKINTNVNAALAQIKLDSLQKTYTAILTQLDKTEPCTKAQVLVSPLPDQSIEQLNQSKLELRKRLQVIETLRNPKKVVRL